MFKLKAHQIIDKCKGIYIYTHICIYVGIYTRIYKNNITIGKNKYVSIYIVFLQIIFLIIYILTFLDIIY